MDPLTKKYEKDRIIWNECAKVYERQIVGGHPDIVAFEQFEESFLDAVLRHLAETRSRPIKVLDIGCGSGRLHLRYVAKTMSSDKHPDLRELARLKSRDSGLMYDPLLEEKLSEVWGIDFSSEMIQLAEQKLADAELREPDRLLLTLREGSAFDLEPERAECFPVAMCLVNSIGVMQGPAGAEALFQSMRRAVESAGGIAMISCYQGEYLESYGLNQYESTMDVSGQPRWMEPDRYADPSYLQVPRRYKRAFLADPTMAVDVYDRSGKLVEEEHVLERNTERTRETLESKHILTHWDYESNWYSFDQLDAWIERYWHGNSYHFRTRRIDAVRALPAQLAILDCGNALKDLLKKWSLVH